MILGGVLRCASRGDLKAQVNMYITIREDIRSLNKLQN